jgi:hypothetical protein
VKLKSAHQCTGFAFVCDLCVLGGSNIFSLAFQLQKNHHREHRALRYTEERNQYELV